MKEKTIGFIGLGNMASAIIKGLRQSRDFRNLKIIGFDLDEDKRDLMSRDYDVAITENTLAVAKDSDILILAVKPQSFDELLPLLVPVLKEKQLVISIAAGKPLAYLCGYLGKDQPILRVTPNINAKAGASMTAICQNEAVSPEQLEAGSAIFDAIGSVIVLEESKMPAFSAIASAGPAFAFTFIDALSTAGIRAGLPRAVAQQAASAMLFGSAKLVAESGEHPRALVDQVTSPGGTTIEGTHTLSRLGFEHAVQEAVKAVIDKEKTLMGKAKDDKQ
ncbi:MAG: pyrroline-5-carboxylate reductase [Bacillota bacterium]|nr:pyrroline-5-carboxylate reductase [Bacillota bacterium]